MTNVKDRDTLPDIVEFQGFQLFIDNKKESLSSLHTLSSSDQITNYKR